MIGKKIKELADKKGLTNEQVALGLDMTVSNLYKIYNKTELPEHKSVLHFAGISSQNDQWLASSREQINEKLL